MRRNLMAKMFNIRDLFRLISLLASLFVLFNSKLNIALAETNENSFIRISRDSNNKLLSLDTVVARYTKNDVSVDLISAVHIGEAEYYQKLNQLFQSYDALLFELIAPEDANFAKNKENSQESVLSKLQSLLKSALGLEFQLDKIDYTKANFVHADMTPELFMQSMQDRGESIWSILIKVMLRSQELEANSSGISAEGVMLNMLLSPNRTLTLRTLLAEQMENMEAITEILDGPEGSTIISERNKVALSVLKREIAAGKKKFGIFYGAGHMPDLASRLVKEFGMQKQSDDWIVAWKLQ